MVISFVGKIICCVDTCINVGGGVLVLNVYDTCPFKDTKTR